MVLRIFFYSYSTATVFSRWIAKNVRVTGIWKNEGKKDMVITVQEMYASWHCKTSVIVTETFTLSWRPSGDSNSRELTWYNVSVSAIDQCVCFAC